jgi:N6-L-threonylcarbamoyladenine synthase
MRDRAGFEFSFSGLKTAVMLAVRAQYRHAAGCPEPARGAQDAIVDLLVSKTAAALGATDLKHLVVAGGVSANTALRTALEAAAAQHGAAIYFPRFEFCTDNAAMIAVAGLARLKAGAGAPDLTIDARAQWPLMSVRAP